LHEQAHQRARVGKDLFLISFCVSDLSFWTDFSLFDLLFSLYGFALPCDSFQRVPSRWHLAWMREDEKLEGTPGAFRSVT